MDPTNRKRSAVLLLVYLVLFLPSRILAQEWRHYGGDAGGMRHSPLAQIDRGNVARLARAWTYHTGEPEGAAGARGAQPFECTPLFVDGTLYLSTPSSRVIALDAETGQERWKFDPSSHRRGPHRGVAYWEGAGARGARDRRIIFGTADGRLIALDASTGTRRADFGRHGEVDLREGRGNVPGDYAVTSPPAIYRDLVIVGGRVPEYPSRGPSGVVRAYDVRNGRLVWEFQTVPREGEQGSETWPRDGGRDRTGVNVWSVMSVDEERGLIFLPVGSPAYDFYGGDRHGANLFGNSLVALEAASGRRVWHYQMVHHDLWDYDLPAQPTLMTVRRGGRRIPAVAQVTKMGFIFILDRVTGEPLFPIEERGVKPSEVPGERAAPTQPFPTLPAPLSRLAITRQDLSRVTPESEKYCRELFEAVVNGSIFTPLGLRPTLVFPGTLGGGNWSGASFDPATGYLYVNANEVGMIGEMRAEGDLYRRGSQWGEYARFWDLNRWPCQAPPWGTLNAIDAATGERVWRVPLGVVDELEQRGRPATGALNLGGSLLTAGGLVFIAATNDRRFRAFDSATGRELWAELLEANGHALPMTYRSDRSGRQFVVIAAGGSGYFSSHSSDALRAFALPSGEKKAGAIPSMR
jgi:quinoprotein glucose dehydrogenase